MARPEKDKKYVISPFYKSLKAHLSSHFTNLKNLEQSIDRHSKRDGIFIKKVNKIILANLEKEGFDATFLATEMALSRSQLFRRLKPLIGHTPAKYIRFVRLHKAKELLEAEDLTVGEVAFKTGFMDPSHFTRAFKDLFGFNPSILRIRNNPPDNNNEAD